jgi:hypothetical protein
MVGHIAENSLAIDHEFREGNAAPAARNLEFVQARERKMPKGKRIKAVRTASARSVLANAPIRLVACPIASAHMHTT